jgi:F-type H+-transporting ATPase subunit c
MTESAIYALAAALAIALSTMFPALGQGKAAKAALESIARQPDAAKEIRSTLLLSLALMEALTIYGLLIAFIIVNKI